MGTESISSHFLRTHYYALITQHPNSQLVHEDRKSQIFYLPSRKTGFKLRVNTFTCFMSSGEFSKNGHFPATRWSLILAKAEEANLEELCRIYWGPIYGFLRRTGRSREDAEDLTQSFFAQISAKGSLPTVDASKGKLRSFLLGALKRHLVDDQRATHTLKRGGRVEHLPLAISERDLEEMDQKYAAEPADEESPDRLFDRAWALNVLERAHERIRQDYQNAGKGKEYELLKEALATVRDIDRTVVAKSLKVAEGTVRVLVHRLRQNFRAALKQEISETVETREQVSAELQHLMASF